MTRCYTIDKFLNKARGVLNEKNQVPAYVYQQNLKELKNDYNQLSKGKTTNTDCVNCEKLLNSMNLLIPN